MTIASVARLVCVAWAFLVSTVACRGQQRPVWEIDVTRGTEIHRGILGHTWEFQLQSPLKGHATVMRGVAGGLAAENFDWRRVGNKRSGGKWGSTLQFLRDCRDNNWDPLITVNLRGLLDPNRSSQYADTDPIMLARLAADWVRYCNHILPTYRRGDVIDSDEDRRIIESISWEGEPVLMEPGEADVPRVDRWEIGNEPSAFAGNLPGGAGPHVFTHRPEDYVHRYKTITQAMVAADPTIKVGPCFADDFRDLSGKPFVMALLRSDARIDLLSYHKYAHLMHGWPDEGVMLGTLQELRRELDDRHTRCVAALVAAGRDPSGVDLALTEYNAASWGVNSVQLSMARALGTGVYIHQLAEKGYRLANHWDRLAFDNAPWPTALLMQRYVSDLGSVMLGRYRDQAIDVIATRQSSSEGDLILWAFNLDPREMQRMTLRVPEGVIIKRISQVTLAATHGSTTLQSRNTPADPKQVAWSTPELQDVRGDDLVELDIPAMSVRQWRIQATMPPTLVVPQIYPKRDDPVTTAPAVASVESGSERRIAVKAAENLSAVVSDGTVRLSWQRGAGSTQHVERCDDDIDYLQVAKLGPSAASFTDTDVAPGGTYQYRIVTRSSDGRSVYSPSVAVAVRLGEATAEDDVVTGSTLEDARLLAHWPFDGKHQFTDLTRPDSRHEAFGPAGISTVDGRGGLALQKGSYVRLDDPPTLPIGPGHEGTVTFWIKTTAQRGVILAKNESHDGPAAYEYGVMLDPPGRIRWMSAVHVRGFKTQIGVSDKSIADGAWHHVAITFSGATGRFYVDGVAAGVFRSLERNVLMQHALLIGANRTWRPDLIHPSGEIAIADLRIYANALSPEAVVQLSSLRGE